MNNNNRIAQVVFDGFDNTPSVIIGKARNDMFELVYQKMAEMFGASKVSKVLTGSNEDRLKKEIAVAVGMVEEGKTAHELCVTLKITGKEYKDRLTEGYYPDKIEKFDRQALAEKYDRRQAELAEAKQARAEQRLNKAMEDIYSLKDNVNRASIVNMLKTALAELGEN